MDELDAADLIDLCKNNAVPQVRQLIAEGVDVNKGSANGFTPLMTACYEGHEEVLNTLLEAKADICQCTTDDKGITALLVACRRGPIPPHCLGTCIEPIFLCWCGDC